MTAVSLVTAGIGKITLVDSDIIELSNLTRQFLFTEEDIGQYKVEILQRELLKRNSSTIISTLNLCIKSQLDMEKLPKCDLILLSADSPWGLSKWVNRFCQRSQIPFINVGYIQDIAVWGPFVIPGKTGCWECQTLAASTEITDPEVTMMMNSINSFYQAPSIGPINMLASSLALLDILKYFGNFGEIATLNKRMGLWTHQLKFESQSC